ncbi:MAG: bifunctional DNA primase/polymerase [Hyphomicrobiaceae bacterium]
MSETEHRTSHNARVALEYANHGIPVFPCAPSGPGAKRPLTNSGHHDATAEVSAVARWWHHWPKALVGVPTGAASGVWVLDVDGDAGRRSLNSLLVVLGLDSIGDLTGCVSRTPSGGLHLIFALQPGERPRNRVKDLGAGLDTRGVREDGASGGYFIAPGSMMTDGRRYELVDPFTLEPIAGAL